MYTGLKIFLRIRVEKNRETIKIQREGNKANNRITALDLMRTEFGLFRDLL